MHIKTIHFLSARALLLGLGLAAASGPVLAGITLPAPVLTVLSDSPEFFKRPSAVGVTNTTTGEQGCHNEKTQTSEPGPCPKDH